MKLKTTLVGLQRGALCGQPDHEMASHSILNILQQLCESLRKRQRFSSKFRGLISRSIEELDILYADLWQLLQDNCKDGTLLRKREPGILSNVLKKLLESISGKRGIDIFSALLRLLED